MNRIHTLIASLALGAAGAAFAQGNPPTTAPANPATAAGQQNPAGGPMGTTGTTPQNTSPGTGTMSQGSAGSTSGSMSSGSANSGSTMPAEQPMRQARADRN